MLFKYTYVCIYIYIDTRHTRTFYLVFHQREEHRAQTLIDLNS